MSKPFLTVVIRNLYPLTMDEPVEHRTVRIDFTPEQLKKLEPRHVGSCGGGDYYEDYSQAFIEFDGEDNEEEARKA